MTTQESLLQATISKNLSVVMGEFHRFNGQIGSKPLRIRLGFGGEVLFCLHGSPDGRYLLIDNESPDPVFMGDGYGETVIRDLACMEIFQGIKDRKVKSASRLQMVENGDEVGIKLIFEGNQSLYIFNWGDELLVATTLPEVVAQEGVAEKEL